MAKLRFIIIGLISLIVITSCNSSKDDKKHFISQPDYRKKVETQFEKVKAIAEGRQQDLFSVFQEDISLEEQEALMFLYAYMPLSDLANNNGDFYLKQVRNAFKTRESFKWGKDIPEDVFRHFVLPYRVNNEDVDSSRIVFYKELYPRIKDMDVEQAALEVNHWCHEKVNYKATDGRTMSPLGVIKTAYGRCGEESTFTVTAMRAVGIPARQVYTPRWAHTDDNHAWVEVFVNGQWKYLGACEPKPELNIAWFDAPVLRAMMVHTKAFGQYQGSESVLGIYKQHSVLNLLSNYVPVKTLYVKITDDAGKPLSDVNVDFGLYNYAEFYPLKSEKTNADGLASLITGLGDIRIFASDGKSKFATTLVSVSEQDTVNLQLNQIIGSAFEVDFDYNPPVAKIPDTSDVDQTANNIRFKQEDEMREAYIATFYNDAKSEQLSKTLGLSPERLVKIMPEARGNYPEIENYLKQATELQHPKVLDLLEVIAPKDLHDVTADVLIDHLKHFEQNQAGLDEALVNEYILNPRIVLERLTPYRSFLQQQLATSKAKDVSTTANNLVKWINDNIKIDPSLNYYKIGLSPKGLYNLKVADQKSRDMFFVAGMRSLGFAARIEQATYKPQYFDQEWVDVKFGEESTAQVAPKAFISFSNPSSVSIDPQYRIHFGLAKFDGLRFVTLEYDWEKKWSTFDKRIAIEPGYYQWTTGNRLEDGSVLVRQTYFTIEEGDYKDLSIQIRTDSRPLEVMGSYPHNEGQAIIYAWINPDSEPGKHFLKDVEHLKDDFLQRKAHVKVFTDTKDKLSKLEVLNKFGFNIAEDKEWQHLQQFFKATGIKPNSDFPIFACVLENGDLVYYSFGYNIGTPEQLLKVIDKIK